MNIQLIGPGGAGKSTIGALLAGRLGVAFLDLDHCLAGRIGDIGEYIERHGYQAYARANVETYCSMRREHRHRGVTAFSSGFMTYPPDVHPRYGAWAKAIVRHPNTFVLLPSLDRAECVAETIRRQVQRPFGRSEAREESVIRTRFDIYMAVPARKIETMRPSPETVHVIIRALGQQS